MQSDSRKGLQNLGVALEFGQREVREPREVYATPDDRRTHRQLAPDQIAKIVVDALHGMEFTGTVKTIAPLPDPAAPSLDNNAKSRS